MPQRAAAAAAAAAAAGEMLATLARGPAPPAAASCSRARPRARDVGCSESGGVRARCGAADTGRREALLAAAVLAATVGASVAGAPEACAGAQDGVGAGAQGAADAGSDEPKRARGGKVLVLGASGRVGAAVSAALLQRGTGVIGLVRSTSRVDPALLNDPNFAVAEGEITELSTEAMRRLLRGCSACVCCLGHRLSFEGIYGPPARLVSDAAALVCDAAAGPDASEDEPLRLVLLSSSGVDNPAAAMTERALRSSLERAFLVVLGALLPPQADNVEAARIVAASGRCSATERLIVRPDDLLEGNSSDYVASELLLNGIFDAKETHIAAVGAFIGDALTDEKMWEAWRGKAPMVVDARFA